jgi:hypothetical protein
MPLVQNQLQSDLQSQWLASEGSSYPQSATESGDRFARAVASWFSSAQAAGLPCATAMARMPQLAQLAGVALQARAAVAAGNALAQAVAQYILGQSFGPGVATFPVALAAAQAQIGAVFGNLDMAVGDRARDIASACTVLATSTMVTFPPPMSPAPIT